MCCKKYESIHIAQALGNNCKFANNVQACGNKLKFENNVHARGKKYEFAHNVPAWGNKYDSTAHPCSNYVLIFKYEEFSAFCSTHKNLEKKWISKQ